MANIYKYSRLNDDFDNHTGSLTDYWTTVQPPSGPGSYGPAVYGADTYQSVASNLLNPLTLEPRYHYDLRLFHGNVNIPFTQLDYNFWHGYPYNKMDTYNVGVNRPLGALYGQETWTGGTVAKNATYRYSSTLTMNVAVPSADSTYGPSTYGTTSMYGMRVNQAVGLYSGETTSASAGGYGTATFGVGLYHGPMFKLGDDISQFTDPTGSHQYYIDILLRSFPAQAAGTHFDLTNSWFDVSSSIEMDDAVTDKFKFSDSLNSVTAGGDTYLRFPVSGITKADKTNLQAARFRLRAVGGTATFIANAVRIVRDDYLYKQIDIDTKTQELARSLPQSGGTEPSSVFGELYFKNERPRDTVYVAAFNAGHNPVGNDNTLRLFFRTKANGDRIEVVLTSRSTQSRLQVNQILNTSSSTLGATPTSANILTEEAFYYLVVRVSDTTVNASIYRASGISLGSLVYTTGDLTTGLTGAGYVGYSFEPYNYDFTLQYLGPRSSYFAKYQTKTYGSRKLVSGVTLYPVNNLPVNTISDATPYAWGDATTSIDENGDVVIQRAGTEVQGGVRWLPPVFTGDTSQLIIHGQLWTSDNNGVYRASLLDPFDNVKWIGNMTNIQPNIWNDFFLAVAPDLLPTTSILHIQQLGQYNTIFKLRDVSLAYKTVFWNAISTVPADTVATLYRGAVMGDSPKGYWRLGETSGNFVDSSGRNHTGTAVGGITYSQTGKIGNGITLNGTTGYFTVADDSDFDTGDVFTLEAWVKFAGTPGATMVLFEKGTGSYRFEIDTDRKPSLWALGVGNITKSTTAVPDDGGFHHVVAVKNGSSSAKIYLDSVDVSGTVTNQTITNTATAIGIGAGSAGGLPFGGSLDEVAIYPTALTSVQVANHYSAAFSTGVPYVATQPFLNSLGQEFSGVQFIKPVSDFKIQALATSDLAWISGFEVVPKYIFTPA